MSAERPSVRVDRWLLATRSFKTRTEATEACVAGKVKVNGDSVKPAKLISLGDRVEVRCPRGLRILEVQALAEKRLSPLEAAKLFLDHSPPPDPRPPRPVRIPGEGRPTKRDRRQMERLWED